MAWGRKTGGRKKGTPNKRTSVLAAKADAAVAGSEGEMPLDYMMRVMRDPTTEPHRQDAMAKAAAPYLHPQLAAIHHRHTNIDGTPISPTINLTFNPPVAAVEAPKPKLTHEGAKDGDTVQ
jgi:hypothetical protein